MDFLLRPVKRYVAGLVQARLADFFENIELDGEMLCAKCRGTSKLFH